MDYYDQPQVEHVYYVAVNPVKQAEEIRGEVRAAYGEVVEANTKDKCCGNGKSYCGVSAKPDHQYSQELGYSKEELESVPGSSNMGLGCGNPAAIASLKKGERVLDLGSGGGFDAFLAAAQVGEQGRVYGVDMTPAMITASRESATRNEYRNVDFLLGEIEHLPLPNTSVDVIISNCVINLSTDKQAVFEESFRVLKEGGRLAISDMVADKPLPPEMVNDTELYCNCISGAITAAELENILKKAGFTDIVIETQESSRMFVKEWVPGSDAENYVVSAKISAVKPIIRKR